MCVPPFAEELNKCRRMLALAAHSVAAIGAPALLLDLYGTGDSAGAFGAARWETWLEDLARGLDWLKGRGARRITLLAVRAGSLLAAQIAARRPGEVRAIIFWQPVFAGSQHLTQLLRTKVAANLGEPRDSALTVDALRGAIAAGSGIEVAGYQLSAELATSLNAARLEEVTLPQGLQIDLFEIVASSGLQASPAAAKILNRWTGAGLAVRSAVIVGDPFWSTAEIATVPSLIEATTAAVGEIVS